MKNNLNLLLIFIIFSSLFFSCKKGPQDPFITFRSRKERVAGDWKITSFESEVLLTFGAGSITRKAKITTTINGEDITIKVDSIETQHDTTIIWKGKIKDNEYRFDKSSRMEHILKYEIIDTKETVNEETGIKEVEKIITTKEIKGSGTWNFLGNIEKNGIEKYKNKERIALIYEYFYIRTDSVYQKIIYDAEDIPISSEYWTSQKTESFGYANGRRAEIWRIYELRNVKMVLEHKVDDYEVTNIITHNIALGQSSTRTKGKETIVLEPLNK